MRQSPWEHAGLGLCFLWAGPATWQSVERTQGKEGAGQAGATPVWMRRLKDL